MKTFFALLKGKQLYSFVELVNDGSSQNFYVWLRDKQTEIIKKDGMCIVLNCNVS